MNGSAEPVIPDGQIPGLSKTVSRLVMGVDNQESFDQASELFDDFLSRGGNAFDTANIYGAGLMERLLGEWVEHRGVRDEVVIIGKGGHTPNCRPEAVTAQLHESLERLRTDHLDVYLLHRDNSDIPVADFVDVLNEHVRAGRITTFGVSNWSRERFVEAQEYAASRSLTPFSVLSNHFSLAHALETPWPGSQHVTDPADRRWLETSNITLLPWSSQARGFFARASRDDVSDAALVRCYYSDDNFERMRRATVLADRLGVAPTAVALAYVLSQSFPTFPLIGPRSIEEARQSYAAVSIELSRDDVEWLDLRSR